MRWATPQLHDIDALAKMVDPALNGMYPAKSLSRFADIIALCVQVVFFVYVELDQILIEASDHSVAHTSTFGIQKQIRGSLEPSQAQQ